MTKGRWRGRANTTLRCPDRLLLIVVERELVAVAGAPPLGPAVELVVVREREPASAYGHAVPDSDLAARAAHRNWEEAGNPLLQLSQTCLGSSHPSSMAASAAGTGTAVYVVDEVAFVIVADGAAVGTSHRSLHRPRRHRPRRLHHHHLPHHRSRSHCHDHHHPYPRIHFRRDQMGSATAAAELGLGKQPNLVQAATAVAGL